MKRTFIAAVALAATALLTVPSGASAQSTATVSLMHGIPGATVDVVVDGAVVIPNFEPGTMQDISSFAGQTLKNVEVRAAGTDTVVIGPVAELAVPASGNWTVLAHLSADGTPDADPVRERHVGAARRPGSPVVRHTAAAPAVDIVLADGSRPFTNLSNPNEASAALPAGEIAGAKSPRPVAPRSPTSRPSSCRPAPTSSSTPSAASRAARSRSTPRRSRGLGGSPTLVNTGNSLPGDGGSDAAVLLAAAAGVLALTGTGLLVARRRSN